MGDSFPGTTFTVPADRRDRLSTLIGPYISSSPNVRVLDLGCGTGGQVFDLARINPTATFVGADVSVENINAAMNDSKYPTVRGRVSFVAVDLLAADLGRFDVVLADSVLQNIEADDGVLVAKLERFLKPGGVLIATLPYRCPTNSALWMVRRGLRKLRGTRLDRFLLWIGRRLHPDWDVKMLRERMPYMYRLPYRVDGKILREHFCSGAGLDLEVIRNLPRDSIAQPFHNFTVYRKGHKE